MANIKIRDKKLRENNEDDTICFDSNDTLKFPNEWFKILHTTVDQKKCEKLTTKWADTAKNLLKTPRMFVYDDMKKKIPELKNEAGIYEWRLKLEYMGNDLVEPLVFYVGKGDVRTRILSERLHGHGSLQDLFTSAYVGCDDIAKIVSKPKELVLKYEVRVFYIGSLTSRPKQVATNNKKAASRPVPSDEALEQERAERVKNAEKLASDAERCLKNTQECCANFFKLADKQNEASWPKFIVKAKKLINTANDCVNEAYKLVAEAEDFCNELTCAIVSKCSGRRSTPASKRAQTRLKREMKELITSVSNKEVNRANQHTNDVLFCVQKAEEYAKKAETEVAHMFETQLLFKYDYVANDVVNNEPRKGVVREWIEKAELQICLLDQNNKLRECTRRKTLLADISRKLQSKRGKEFDDLIDKFQQVLDSLNAAGCS